MKRKISLIIFAAIFSASLLSCRNRQTGNAVTLPTVKNNTLLISSSGRLVRYNLDSGKAEWGYSSQNDENENNENKFALHGDTIFTPFSSGLIAAVRFTDGKQIWSQQIAGGGSGNEDAAAGSDGSIDKSMLQPKMPLFAMATPVFDKGNLYIVSSSRKEDDHAALYSYQMKDGALKWAKELPALDNEANPVISDDAIYVSSGEQLMKFGTAPGAGYKGVDKVKLTGGFICMAGDKDQLIAADHHYAIFSFSFEKTKGHQLNIYPQLLQKGEVLNASWSFLPDRGVLLMGKFLTDEENVYAAYHKAQDDAGRKTMVYALDKENGKQQWSTEMPDILDNYYDLDADYIAAYSEQNIYLVKKSNGKISTTIKIHEDQQPYSNIERRSEEELIYLSQGGIVTLNLKTEKFKIQEMGVNSSLGLAAAQYNQILFIPAKAGARK